MIRSELVPSSSWAGCRRRPDRSSQRRIRQARGPQPAPGARRTDRARPRPPGPPRARATPQRRLRDPLPAPGSTHALLVLGRSANRRSQHASRVSQSVDPTEGMLRLAPRTCGAVPRWETSSRMSSASSRTLRTEAPTPSPRPREPLGIGGWQLNSHRFLGLAPDVQQAMFSTRTFSTAGTVAVGLTGLLRPERLDNGPRGVNRTPHLRSQRAGQ